jgi:uncharacterized protein involved in type VI secretion and phage assembly
VLSNADPQRLGRITATVPDVLGQAPSPWALPCFPTAGIQAGIYAVPAPGSGVWIEFEQGDADRPIWSGCWYGSAAEVPAHVLAAPPDSPPIVLQTPSGNAIRISDAADGAGILLTTSSGAWIRLGDSGIELANGKGATVRLVGSQVHLNERVVDCAQTPP